MIGLIWRYRAMHDRYVYTYTFYEPTERDLQHGYLLHGNAKVYVVCCNGKYRRVA